LKLRVGLVAPAKLNEGLVRYAVLEPAIQSIVAELFPAIVNLVLSSIEDAEVPEKTELVKSHALDAFVLVLVHPVGGNVAPSKFSESRVWALP